jgi:nucleoside-diphosphate-sugar epimerase
VRSALVYGAGGFIGNHMVKRLKQEGFWVRGVDLKYPEFSDTEADDFIIGDLSEFSLCLEAMDRHFDEVYQFAADMGGAGFIFTGENDADIMHNSALVNLNVLKACIQEMPGRLFYASSACIYPEHNQLDLENLTCAEDSAYPAYPDSEYGWEKLFSERIYMAFHKNKGLNVRIGRYHNIIGPEGTWHGGREKSPAAICRKVAVADVDGEIEIWGDGSQTRSFLYIDECIEGTLRLTRSDWTGPVNIGSDEMITINKLAERIIQFSGKKLSIKHVKGPLGVSYRNSDNRRIQKKLGWRPTQPLVHGLKNTYDWIDSQVKRLSDQEKECL